MTLIADSGSTKTAWCVAESSHDIIYTQGINPFQQNEEEICAVLRHELLPSLQALCHRHQDPSKTMVHPPLASTEAGERVFFYGAGCTPEKAPIVAQALRQVLGQAVRISVESDMLGAARGLCGRQPGIVAILGTGSNSCFYDGRHLHTGNPALGYILGDEGSGAYIGKRLVGDILKRQLPDDVCQLFFDETHETQASIIQKVYRTPLPNRFLASLSPFCIRHRQHPAIHAFIIDCFEQFFNRNIRPALPRWRDITPDASTLSGKPQVHFVGSIAHFYRSELTEAAAQCGYQVGHIMQSPLEGLVEFHREGA